MHSNLSNFGDYILWRVENEPRFQTDFIVNSKGDLGINYLGRFEYLDKDFECCCNHLNISRSLPKKMSLLPKIIGGTIAIPNRL